MLDIRYEDEALLIVNKPPGILVHPTTKEDETTLSAQISRYYQRQGWQLNLHPVSRLDRQTSGLVVFAKLPEIQGQLIKQGMQKEYLALVTGILPASHGIIDYPIARKPGSIIEREINPEGKPCKTEYWVVSSSDFKVEQPTAIAPSALSGMIICTEIFPGLPNGTDCTHTGLPSCIPGHVFLSILPLHCLMI